MTTPVRKPYLPSELVRAGPPNAARAFERAMFAHARHALDPHKHKSVEDLARKTWPDDELTLAVIQRAAVSPATTTSPTWAAALSPTAVGAFIGSLAPESAASRLIELGTKVSLDGLYSVTLPARTTVPSARAAAWVAEGAPMPAVSYTLGGAQLGPMRKMALVVAFTREQASNESIFGMLLREEISETLDASMFDDVAGSSSRPAGLRYNVTPITATAGGGEPAMLMDLTNIAAALATAGGSGSFIYVMAPAQFAYADLTLKDRTITSLPSRALADGTVIGIDPSRFVSAFSSEARLDASDQSVIHFEDSAPAHIGVPDTPANLVSATSREAYQHDLIMARIRLDAAFVMRSSGVQYVAGTSWG